MLGPLHITAFARDDDSVRGTIKDLVNRYQLHKPDLQLSFVNPDLEPDRVRDEGISHDGELMVSYQNRSHRVSQLSEQQLTNAMLVVARQGERWIVYLSGHGERNPLGQANHDHGVFGQTLALQGLHVRAPELGQECGHPREHPGAGNRRSTRRCARGRTGFNPGIPGARRQPVMDGRATIQGRAQ